MVGNWISGLIPLSPARGFELILHQLYIRPDRLQRQQACALHEANRLVANRSVAATDAP